MSNPTEDADPFWDFIARGYPYDDDTPEETIRAVIREWEDDYQPGMKMKPLESVIIATLVYKAFFVEDEPALRWLDPEGDVQAKLGLNPRRSV